MMNRANQNNQLSSKSLLDDRQINHFLRSRHEKKVLLRSSSTNWNNRLCYEAKIDHEMKKTSPQIVFDRSREIREKSHLSNVTLQRNHLSRLVNHLNKEKTLARCRNLNRNIVKAISLRIIQFFDEKTSSRVKFDNNSHFGSDFSSRDVVVLVLVINHWNQYVIQRFRLDDSLSSQFARTSFRATLSTRLFWLTEFTDYEMHEKCHRFAANSEVAILQEDDEWLKSRRMIESHEKRKQISSDQWDLNSDEFSQKQTSTSRQMSLQNQKRETRRNSALQDALSDSRIRTSRKTKLHRDIRLDD